MGWLFTDVDSPITPIVRKDEVIRQTEYNDGIRSQKVVAYSVDGATSYMAVHASNAETNAESVFGVVVLTTIQNDRFHNFGTKFIDEGMGPVESFAPKSLIDKLTPIDSESANEWRKRCLRNAEIRSSLRKLKEGDKFTVGDRTLEVYNHYNGKTWHRVYKLVGEWKKMTEKQIISIGNIRIAEN